MKNDQYVNKLEIMVNAMQRSGHHSFVEELLSATDRHLFLNCVSSPKMFRRKFINNNPTERFKNDMDLELDKEMAGENATKKLLCYNTEMMSTEESFSIFDDPVVEKSVGKSQQRLYVTWLRDPLNNLASLYQIAVRLRKSSPELSEGKPISEDTKLLKARTLWIDHCKEVMGGTKGVGLVFNAWMRDDEYRQAFYDNLAIEMPPRHEKTTMWGRGSSFKKFEENQTAPSVEEIESRCDLFLGDPEFRELFSEQEFMKQVDEFFERFSEFDVLSEKWNLLRKMIK